MDEKENEKSVNLDGVMYNEDGTFKPLQGSHGNIYEGVAHLRNTYMESEREYFEYLLSIESLRNEFLKYLDCNSDELFNTAMRIQEKIEYGMLESPQELEQMKLMSPEEKDNYHIRKLESAEGLMCLLLAAIRDKVKILELLKTYSNGRNR